MSPKKHTEIRVRIAPSPTGHFHIGTARAALFNYVFAKKHNGTFILRIEDTDTARSKKEFEEEIVSSLLWLGLNYDEGPLVTDQNGASKLLAKPFKGDHGPYRQSERLDIYEPYLKKLLAEKRAYYCFCAEEELEASRQSLLSQGQLAVYSGKCRSLSEKEADARLAKGEPHVIRIKVPKEKLAFTDLRRGEITFDTALIGDIIIAKNLREPLYNLAVVIDDYEMKISHVIRGEDHIANTPKQMVIAGALDFPFPKFCHMPLILNPDRSKMSKRETGALLNEYRRAGYLKEAMINFLALLGWHPGPQGMGNEQQTINKKQKREGEREILSLDELIELFDFSRLQKAGAIFNVEKLNWFNAYYIKQKTDSELLEILTPDYIEPSWADDVGKLLKIIALTKERLKKLSEFKDLARLFFELPDYPKELLAWKRSTLENAGKNLMEAEKILQNLPEIEFQKSHIESALMPLAEKAATGAGDPQGAGGRGEMLWPLRVAVSGSEASPGPFEIIDALGKAETLRRLDIAIEKLQ